MSTPDPSSIPSPWTNEEVRAHRKIIQAARDEGGVTPDADISAYLTKPSLPPPRQQPPRNLPHIRTQKLYTRAGRNRTPNAAQPPEETQQDLLTVSPGSGSEPDWLVTAREILEKTRTTSQDPGAQDASTEQNPPGVNDGANAMSIRDSDLPVSPPLPDLFASPNARPAKPLPARTAPTVQSPFVKQVEARSKKIDDNTKQISVSEDHSRSGLVFTLVQTEDHIPDDPTDSNISIKNAAIFYFQRFGKYRQHLITMPLSCLQNPFDHSELWLELREAFMKENPLKKWIDRNIFKTWSLNDYMTREKTYMYGSAAFQVISDPTEIPEGVERRKLDTDIEIQLKGYASALDDVKKDIISQITQGIPKKGGTRVLIKYPHSTRNRVGVLEVVRMLASFAAHVAYKHHNNKIEQAIVFQTVGRMHVPSERYDFQSKYYYYHKIHDGPSHRNIYQSLVNNDEEEKAFLPTPTP